LHPDEQRSFTDFIHIAQHYVMARPVRRYYHNERNLVRSFS